MRALQGHNIFLNKVTILGHLTPSIIIFFVGSHLWLPFVQSETQIEDISSWAASSPNGNIYWGLVAIFSLFYWWKQNRHSHPSKEMGRIKFIQDLLLLNVLSVSIQIIAIEVFGVFIPMVYAQGPFAAYFVYRALSFSVLPLIVNSAQTVDSVQIEKEDIPADDDKDSNKKLSPDELSTYKVMFDTLEKSLKDGAYRDNELSLGSLASSCDLTYHQASIAINLFSGVNFYEWVRLYRIEESKEILAKTNLSVSTIYYDVGFNSKSSFYTAFKKIVGCTPTEYRKKVGQSQIGT
jgi:AraC-like DNA-binding protein